VSVVAAAMMSESLDTTYSSLVIHQIGAPKLEMTRAALARPYRYIVLLHREY
jgi:predicted phosphoribosyltransferase